MKSDNKTVKCSNCGSMNIKQAKKCKKCGNDLKQVLKSCPKCAKRNDIKVDRCVNCGYNFNRKDPSLIVNLIITIVFVISLLVLVFLNKEFIVDKINEVLKIAAIMMIALIFIETLTYGKKEIVALPGEDDDVIKGKYKFIRGRTIILFLLTILLIGACIYCYIKYYR